MGEGVGTGCGLSIGTKRKETSFPGGNVNGLVGLLEETWFRLRSVNVMMIKAQDIQLTAITCIIRSPRLTYSRPRGVASPFGYFQYAYIAYTRTSTLTWLLGERVAVWMHKIISSNSASLNFLSNAKLSPYAASLALSGDRPEPLVSSSDWALIDSWARCTRASARACDEMDWISMLTGVWARWMARLIGGRSMKEGPSYPGEK